MRDFVALKFSKLLENNITERDRDYILCIILRVLLLLYKSSHQDMGGSGAIINSSCVLGNLFVFR